MPPVTPRRMRLPCMESRPALGTDYRTAPAGARKPSLRKLTSRVRKRRKLRDFGGFLPLPALTSGSLDWPPDLVRTESNEHPALASPRAAPREAARARRSRALGCGAAGAAPRLGHTGAHRGRARAHADRRVRLVARAVELGGAALPRTERHRTCPLRHPQGGPRARAAALSRSAALGSRACGARSHPDVSRGAPA